MTSRSKSRSLISIITGPKYSNVVAGHEGTAATRTDVSVVDVAVVMVVVVVGAVVGIAVGDVVGAAVGAKVVGCCVGALEVGLVVGAREDGAAVGDSTTLRKTSTNTIRLSHTKVTIGSFAS